LQAIKKRRNPSAFFVSGKGTKKAAAPKIYKPPYLGDGPDSTDMSPLTGLRNKQRNPYWGTCLFYRYIVPTGLGTGTLLSKPHRGAISVDTTRHPHLFKLRRSEITVTPGENPASNGKPHI
jgi:hypothetical protein